MAYLRAAATVQGYPALYLARLLRTALEGSATMQRDRAELLVVTLHDLERAADAWQREREAEPVTADPLPPTPDEIGVAEAAALLGRQERWVRVLADRGDIAARKVGRAWRIERADVLAYRERRDAA